MELKVRTLTFINILTILALENSWNYLCFINAYDNTNMSQAPNSFIHATYLIASYNSKKTRFIHYTWLSDRYGTGEWYLRRCFSSGQMLRVIMKPLVVTQKKSTRVLRSREVRCSGNTKDNLQTW